MKGSNQPNHWFRPFAMIYVSQDPVRSCDSNMTQTWAVTFRQNFLRWIASKCDLNLIGKMSRSKKIDLDWHGWHLNHSNHSKHLRYHLSMYEQVSFILNYKSFTWEAFTWFLCTLHLSSYAIWFAYDQVSFLIIPLWIFIGLNLILIQSLLTIGLK